MDTDQGKSRLIAHDVDGSYGEEEAHGCYGGAYKEERLELEGGNVRDESSFLSATLRGAHCT
jgi:hypothetical protein